MPRTRPRLAHRIALRLALGAALLASGCSKPVEPAPAAAVSVPSDFDAMDPRVAALVRKTVGQARAAGPGQTAELRAKLAMTYQANGLEDLAADTWRQALDLDGGRARWWYHLARAEKSLGRVEAALEALDRALTLEPGYAPAHARRGFWRLEDGALDDADAAFARAIKRDPASIVARIGHAIVLLARGEHGTSLETLGALRPEAPDDPYVRFLLGTALRRSGDRNRAVVELAAGAGSRLSWKGRDRWALEVQPFWTGYRASFAKAQALIGARRPAKAIEILRGLVGERPDDAASVSLLHSALMSAGRVEEAVAAIERGLERNPDHFALHLNLAVAFEQQGRLPLALRHTRRAIELNPTLAAAHVQLGRELIMANEFDQANTALERAIAADPANLEAYRLLGTAHLNAQRVDAALPVFRRMTVLFPDRAEGWHLIGLSELSRGQPGAARQALERALRLDPRNEEIRQLLRQLGP